MYLSNKDALREHVSWISLKLPKHHPNQRLETEGRRQRRRKIDGNRRLNTTCRIGCYDLSRWKVTGIKKSDEMTAMPRNWLRYNHNVISLDTQVANRVWVHNRPPKVKNWPIHRQKCARYFLSLRTKATVLVAMLGNWRQARKDYV